MHGMREIAELAAQLVFAGVWQGLVLVGLLSLAFRLLPRSGARLRSALWVFGFALAVLVPLLHLLSAGSVPTSAAAPHEVLRIEPAWGYALAALWAVLVLVRGTRLAIHGIRLRGIWRRATAMATEGGLREMLTSGGRRAVLCRSAEVESPAVIGFFAPRLLLPEALVETMNADDLGQIVLHEMEHLRRLDDWVNLLQKLALVLFPLDPALLWIDRRLSVERELACDAGVVARTAAPIAYAACLARLAEHRMHSRVAALSLAAWSRRPELSRRVETLLRPTGAMSRTQTKFAVALLLLGLGGGAAEMARAPKWIALVEPGGGAVRSVAAADVQDSGSRVRGLPAVPVVYRNDAAMRTLLQNAVYVPDGSTSGAVMATRKKQHAASVTAVSARPARKRIYSEELQQRTADSGPRAVLASSPDNGAQQTSTGRMPPRRRIRTLPSLPVYTLTIQHLPSYAAVPFGDGWILVQL